MIFFELIDIVAVLATAFFMMALCTIWYSSMLFGKVWNKEVGILPLWLQSTKGHMLLLGTTFVCYVIALCVLSYVVTIAPLLSLSLLQIASLSTLFALALLGMFSVAEGRRFPYYFVNAGFLAVFITGGILILAYWPW